MAVLVEAISIIVRRGAIEQRFPGGWHGFLGSVPNETLCSDQDLARVGFMCPEDVGTYATSLEEAGLVFRRDGHAVDFAVVDQLRGPTVPAPWLEFGKIEIRGVRISACWLAGQSPKEIALPEGWTYENSLSGQTLFVETDKFHGRLEFLRHADGLDVYRDLTTGKEVFLGRSGVEGKHRDPH